MAKKTFFEVFRCIECGAEYKELSVETIWKIKAGQKDAFCKECRKKWAIQHYQDKEAELFYAVKFPELKGTEKQVKWAERIMKHWTMDVLISGMEIELINFLLSYATSAAGWIKNRDLQAHMMTRILLMANKMGDVENGGETNQN